MISRLFIQDEKLKVSCHFTLRSIPQTVEGCEWNKVTRTWDFPKRLTTIPQIVSAFEDEHQELEIDVPKETQVSTPVDLAFLFEYQHEGSQFLVDVKRALLADEMGLGKTVQALAACQTHKRFPVLIICPNTLKWNWHHEILKWFPNATIQVVEGDPKTRQIQIRKRLQYTIINYKILSYTRASAKLKKGRPWSADVKTLISKPWGTLIVDEAHRVKNRKAQATKATRLIAKRSDHAYLLSGTPFENRCDELWSLLNILYPKKFSSYWNFVETYSQISHNGYGLDVGDSRTEMLPQLRRRIHPFTLRRLKRDVLKSLPAKLPVRQLWVDLTPEHRRVYQEMAQQMYTKLLTGEIISAAVVIAQITRLKQIAIDPGLMLEESRPLSGAKVDALLEFIEDHLDQKIVIFSQFARVLNSLELICQVKKFSYVKITGDVTGKNRHQAVQTFQTNTACRLCLCGMKSGGIGITLTAAHTAIFLDKFWSPAINWQAQERLDRIGQTEAVTTIEILALGTIEEKIEALLSRKSEQFLSIFPRSAPLETSSAQDSTLSKEQLLSILKTSID